MGIDHDISLSPAVGGTKTPDASQQHIAVAPSSRPMQQTYALDICVNSLCKYTFYDISFWNTVTLLILSCINNLLSDRRRDSSTICISITISRCRLCNTFSFPKHVELNYTLRYISIN